MIVHKHPSMKIQVLMVHGGQTFKNEKEYVNYLKTKQVTTKKKISWSGAYLEKSLGKGFEVITPRMPLQDNARYKDWKILFERYLSVLTRDFILIGNSLGGIFLAKYLSENVLSKKPLGTYLVCPPFDNTLPSDDLVGGFELGTDLSLLEQNSIHLHLLFSKDDECVPVTQAKKYAKKLKAANIVIYEGKNGHFNVPTFPEIVRMIKRDCKR